MQRAKYFREPFLHMHGLQHNIFIARWASIAMAAEREAQEVLNSQGEQD